VMIVNPEVRTTLSLSPWAHSAVRLALHADIVVFTHDVSAPGVGREKQPIASNTDLKPASVVSIFTFANVKEA